MQTSILNRNQAFFDIISDLSNKRKSVYNSINKSSNITCREIAKDLSLPINSITGRVTELKNMFLIVESGSKVFLGRKHTCYRITTLNDRLKLWDKEFLSTRNLRDLLVNDFQKSNLCQESKDILKLKIEKLNKRLLSLYKISETWR